MSVRFEGPNILHKLKQYLVKLATALCVMESLISFTYLSLVMYVDLSNKSLYAVMT
jgi:hypothetical protein